MTCDLSQAEEKMNVVTSWANAQNDIDFTQNGWSCHCVCSSACMYSFYPSIIDGVYRNENFVEIIPFFSSFSNF